MISSHGRTPCCMLRHAVAARRIDCAPKAVCLQRRAPAARANAQRSTAHRSGAAALAAARAAAERARIAHAGENGGASARTFVCARARVSAHALAQLWLAWRGCSEYTHAFCSAARVRFRLCSSMAQREGRSFRARRSSRCW
jgi:hypothetical protein